MYQNRQPTPSAPAATEQKEHRPCYTAKHSSGATKTRTSRGHLQPQYTHALWTRYLGDEDRPAGEWTCCSMGKRTSVEKESNRYRKNGRYEIEIGTLEASS